MSSQCRDELAEFRISATTRERRRKTRQGSRSRLHSSFIRSDAEHINNYARYHTSGDNVFITAGLTKLHQRFHSAASNHARL